MEQTSEPKKFLNFVAELYNSISKFEVCPKVEPGFLRDCLPKTVPEKPLSLPEIITEVEKIQSGALQWQHPYFFGYFPSSMSHSTIIAEMFANFFQTKCTEWKDSPIQIELEILVADWLAKIMGLPDNFLRKNEGGGVMCTSVTHGYFNAVSVAKYKKLKEMGLDYSNEKKFKFSAYFSEPAFGWSQKSLNLKEIKYQRKIPVYFKENVGNYEPDMKEFEEIIKKDIEQGLIPFFCAATYGYTATCGFDDVEAIGNICKKYGIFLLADAAYACSFMILDEFKYKFKGLDLLDCIILNLSKNFMISNVGTLFYINNKQILKETFSITTNENQDFDYKDWVPECSRKWNSLKIYYLIKHLGVKGLQQYIRHYIELAKLLEELMILDKRFIIICKREFSVIVFQIAIPEGSNLTKNESQREFYRILTEDTKEGYFSMTHLGEEELLRIVIGNPNTSEENVKVFWKKLKSCADIFYDKFEKKI